MTNVIRMQVIGQNNQFDCGIYVLYYITLLNQVSQILHYNSSYLILKKDPDIIHTSLDNPTLDFDPSEFRGSILFRIYENQMYVY